MRNTRLVAAAAAALAVAGSLAFAAPAASASIGGKGCTNGSQLVGEFRHNAASSTWEILGDCGSVSVRVAYKTYSGSPTYLTGWAYGTSSVSKDPGNIRVYSNHSGTSVNGGTYFTLT